MTTLSASKVRDYELDDINELPVIGADTIYEGAAVGNNGSGYARPLQGGDTFLGFAEETVDNEDGSDGDKRVRVKSKGKVKLPISGLAVGDLGSTVYASDDDTFTLTSTDNSEIGSVYRFVSSGVGIVAFG
jgi:hypothetical protein